MTSSRAPERVAIMPFTVVAATPAAATLPRETLVASGTEVAPWGVLVGILLLSGVALIVRARVLRTI